MDNNTSANYENNHNDDLFNNFYEHGKRYWGTVVPDVNGMLGGFGQVSHTDIDASSRFLKRFLNRKTNPIGHNRVLDCGAGIGRVTKHLLLHHFNHVDMVEQSEIFLAESYKYIEDRENQIERRIASALQDFCPEPNRYDVIWCQWILSHLIDEDVVKFLSRCKSALTTNGLLVLKDNITSGDEVETDEQDSTVSRPLMLWHELIRKAGFEISQETKQLKFPKELYEVRMFACQVPNSEIAPGNE